MMSQPHTTALQRDLISQTTSRSSTPGRTSKDDAKGKSNKNQTSTGTKRSVRDAFHDDIHVLELKEAAEHRAQKNAIRLKELELQEKRHAAKVRKMEMDAEIQKAHLSMLNNMANMFTSGSMAAVGGIRAMGQAGSGSSTQLDGSTTTESWVHTQQQANTSSGSSSESGQISTFPGAAFNFSANDFNFSGTD